MENKTTDRLSTAEKREFVTLLRDVSAYINPTRFTADEKDAFLKMVYQIGGASCRERVCQYV